MSQREFKLDTTFSDRNNTRWLAAALAGVLLAVIAVTIWTDIPEVLLPMNDVSMRALIPEAADGAEPLGLKSIDQEFKGGTLRVSGVVENRSNTDIAHLLVVIEPIGASGRPEEPAEAPVKEAPLLAHRISHFEAIADLNETPGTYKVRFRIADGPFLPHKDERPAAPPPKPAK